MAVFIVTRARQRMTASVRIRRAATSQPKKASKPTLTTLVAFRWGDGDRGVHPGQVHAQRPGGGDGGRPAHGVERRVRAHRGGGRRQGRGLRAGGGQLQALLRRRARPKVAGASESPTLLQFKPTRHSTLPPGGVARVSGRAAAWVPGTSLPPGTSPASAPAAAPLPTGFRIAPYTSITLLRDITQNACCLLSPLSRGPSTDRQWCMCDDSWRWRTRATFSSWMRPPPSSAPCALKAARRPTTSRAWRTAPWWRGRSSPCVASVSPVRARVVPCPLSASPLVPRSSALCLPLCVVVVLWSLHRWSGSRTATAPSREPWTERWVACTGGNNREEGRQKQREAGGRRCE